VYRLMRRATSLVHSSEIKILLNLSLIMLLLIKINNIHLCEDTFHVAAILRTTPQATHVVRAGDLLPVGTMLVTLACTCQFVRLVSLT